MPRRKATAVDESQTVDPVQSLVAAINKRFGDGTISTASDPKLSVTRWPTGVLPLDHILDGGIPKGRMIEVYGGYSTLKSYMLYKALGAVQRQGGRSALIDTEHSFDPEWAEQLGVDVDKLLITRPETAELGIGVLEVLVRQRYDMIGFDSIAAAIPRQHQEVAPGDDTQPGALARVMSKGLARVNAANSVSSVIFINQTRQKIGVTFGSPTTTSGGLAMQFYASYRLSFNRIGKKTEDFQQWDGEKMTSAKRTVSHKIQVVLEKSKLSAPMADAVFNYDLRTGEIDETDYLVGLALQAGKIIRSTTGRFEIPGIVDKSIHGREAFSEFLADNPHIVEKLKEEVL